MLPLADEVIEAETGFNRPDLLSIYGIAREVAAVFDAELKPMPGREPDRAADPEPVDVRIEDPAGCPRYIGRLFRDVRIGPSPEWLKARLTAAGQRPISNVVDVTNYVMLALGSPLHAFDHGDARGGPRSSSAARRRARSSARSTATSAELDPSDLVIADAERAIALAGIMGGEETEVTEATTDVLLEAANFEPVGIMRSSERLALRTEGSNRWEKGVDPYLAEQAAIYATELLVELAGARYAGETDAHGDLPARPVTRLRPERTDAVAGLEVPPAEQRRILERLGFEVEDADGDRHRPHLARPRRHARDRRDRGGRARPRPGAGALHAAAPPRDVRPADRRAAPRPALRGRRSSAWGSPRRTPSAWSRTGRTSCGSRTR